MDHYLGFRPPLPFEASVAQEQRTSHEFSWLLPQMPPLLPQDNATRNNPSRPTSGCFKTRLCDRFQYDCCPNGDECNFAHGIEDLRRPLGARFASKCRSAWPEQIHIPPNYKEGTYLGDEWKLQKHKVCRKFHSGEVCPFGDRCCFAHAKPGLLQDSTGGGYVSNHNSLYWKTKLCHKFSTSGRCPYGDMCNYAHGYGELRKLGGDHVETKGKDVEDAAPKIGSSFHFDDVLPKTKTEPVSVLQVETKKVRTLTLEKTKQIYGDWIDG
ncbi:Zinc finger CCCH domain-containing protein 39 [Apostasia shenzhenica]|uniref:Zinc finger CCCH domain-containing protein 39 n=1 Tax=Apostasia shenzhenica TaxID=1088818 RepID=A0A2I0B6M2_9ASPA|nr:Zinc finger CCCH domain-containing protein 39 [Apostasia shenzhenica]